MAATNFQPLIEEEGWITIRGGMLRKNVCHMPVMNVRWGAHRLRLTRLVQRDTHLAQLLTGRPACERPLSKLKLWRHLRRAIDAGGGAPSAESAESAEPGAAADDDDIGFAESLGVDEEAPQPAKKKARCRIRGLDFVEIEVVERPGSQPSRTRLIVFENKSELSMDVGEALQNLEWLIHAVLLERRDTGAVSVAHAIPQPLASASPEGETSQGHAARGRLRRLRRPSPSVTPTEPDAEDASEAR